MESSRPAFRPIVHRLSISWLLVVPVLLAVLAGVVLFIHSDLNIPDLYSQCYAHERIPWLSRVPGIGPPSCFMVSFFQFANASVRSLARMSVILAFVSALLTTNLVESARICNQPNHIVRHPTISWLVFNLVGGTLVWDLVIVPAYLRRNKQIQLAKEKYVDQDVSPTDPDVGEESRKLTTRAEIFAIPIAVALGFILPSVLMLALNDPIVILIWLFFPLWVAAVRHAVKLGLRLVVADEPFYLEECNASLVPVYILTVVGSILAHALLIWNMFSQDDRRELTKSCIKFIEIDVSIIGFTVLYWILVEAGSIVALSMIGFSIILGPGAGLVGSWILRERAMKRYPDKFEEGVEADQGSGSSPDEDTPLLQRDRDDVP